jgi:RpiR family carbohydrate utilization transcriptional regulator
MYEIEEDDSIHELCEKVFDTTISEILNVRSQINQDVLESAIEALANAKRVEVYAFGGSAPVAMDGQHKFFRLKIPSSYISDPHLQFMSANSLEKNDVVVAISQSGTTSALIDSVKIVQKNGAKVIGIMPGNTPLANICDFPLTIDVGVNNRISKPLTSRIAYIAVIDVLTMGVAQLKPEAQDHLYNIADSQRSLKIDN